MNQDYLKPAKIDVAVLLIFFTRVEKTAQVFEQIKKARPSKLFLYQDGPRSGRPDDVENIRKCRDVVEDIDWNCEVYRMYQKENKGCDPSEYIAQKWMFSKVDKGIIIEDDDVPSQSFFPFCKELLDKYENDDRINIICGMNNLDTTDSPNSYIFTRYGSIWGWATWRRNVDRWDPEYRWMKDKEIVDNLLTAYPDFKKILATCKKHKDTGREHYESILGAHQYLYHQLNIVPAKNMITNIGIGSETTHSTDSITKLPRATRRLLFKKRQELEFPLQHPQFMVEDIRFGVELCKLTFPKGLRKFSRRVESALYRFFPFLR